MLQSLGSPVEEDQCGRLIPHPERDRPAGRGYHQYLDADQFLAQKLREAPADPVVAAEDDRHRVERDLRAPVEHAHAGEHEGEAGDHSRDEGIAQRRVGIPPP